MHINIFFSQSCWQRSLDPLKTSPTADSCQKALSVRKLNRIADGQSPPATHPSLGLLPVPSGAARCSKPPRPQLSFPTTLTRPQVHLDFRWWEHKCRQWSRLHCKSDSVLIGLSRPARWSRGSKSEAWGPYLCFGTPWLPALRSHGGKGNGRKLFCETDKIQDSHKSSASWKRRKE